MEELIIDDIRVGIGKDNLIYSIPTRFSGKDLNDWMLKNDDELQDLKERYYNRKSIKMSSENKMLNPTGANSFNDKYSYNTKDRMKDV